MHNRKPFLEALADGPLLFDGAMGSLLYDRGVFLTHSYDELNLSRPELILNIHREYLEAGADILETNTFGANRLALAKHGHSSLVEAINRAGVELAHSASRGRSYIAGTIGPTGAQFHVATDAERRLARDAFSEQINILLSAGVELLVLETFRYIQELESAIACARELGGELPVVAHLVFGKDLKTDGGLTPEQAAQRIYDAGAHVVGANCGVGPQELYDVGQRMMTCGAPVALQPNAGLPAEVDGRTIYVANPEHFGVFARRMLKSGIKMLGGCCGTTPEHTRRMLGAVRMMTGRSSPTRLQTVELDASSDAEVEGLPATPLEARSRLGERLARGEFAVSVELTAPTGLRTDKFLTAVRTLVAAGVDIINIADGPRATARMGNLSVCVQAAQATGVEPILHTCCRDRNYLGLVSHLLGAHALGIRNLVIITGDPPKMGDYPFATPVYDVDSVGLLQIAAGLNAGLDPARKDIGDQTSFVLATGAEPGAVDYDRELQRIEHKRDAGAELIMTQPVYDPATLDRFLKDVEPLGLPVMVGLLPLASQRNAEFLHNEVPGMSIPVEYRERMARVPSGPEARTEGVRIAQEALAAVKHRVAGAYIMPPFNRVESALAILDVVRDRWTPQPPAAETA